MKSKIGNDEFCLHCKEWREYDIEGRCKICKHIIHKKDLESEKKGYNNKESESMTFEELEENPDSLDY